MVFAMKNRPWSSDNWSVLSMCQCHSEYNCTYSWSGDGLILVLEFYLVWHVLKLDGHSQVGFSSPSPRHVVDDSKNDRYRAKRDSIARAPREKRRGEATRINTAGCMPYFCTHKTQQCWTQNAPHKWIKPTESSCILHDTPILIHSVILLLRWWLFQSTLWPS